MPEDIYAGERAMLASLVASEKVPHAYIIEGDECAEKKSLAFFLAASLLCTGDRPPCGKCPSCIKAASGNGSGHPDIHFFEPEKNKTLSVDTVRSIKKTVYLLPNEGKRKVYILYSAQRMSRSAQNALLKLFEEPPASAVFIICCDTRSSLLPTVISRGFLISLPSPDDRTLYRLLERKYPAADSDMIKRAVRYACGSIGKADDFMSADTAESIKHAFEFCARIFSGNRSAFSLASYLLPLGLKRDGLDRLLSFTELALLDVLNAHVGPSSAVLLDGRAVEAYRAACTPKTLCRMLDILGDTREYIAANANDKTAAASLCSRLSAV